jgi:signal transduction histidine kinase
MSSESSAALSFPDGPKLELDELIDQLVERAQGVKRAQGRLRELLKAIEIVTGDLSLETVLSHIVQAACELGDAKYGALGVIAPDGWLERFIHVGLDAQTATHIGHLPVGRGLLGALITDPRPIRLAQITGDPRSSGFPPQHPPMNSFLGVPIRVRDEIFGNLYLTESRGGAFTAEDEELVRSLAVAAGTAISNARLYDESRRQQRWLAASAEIGSRLLSASGEDPLRMIARRASDIAGADLVTVGLLTPDGEDIVIEVAVGENGEQLLGQRFSLKETLSGQAIETRSPILLRAPGDGGARFSHLSTVLDAGPIMVLPMADSSKMVGALSLARARGAASFRPAEVDMAAAFADHASLALELANARADQQRVVLLEDRDRIARDLHDHVIQQLFAIGLSLESTATMAAADPAIADRLHASVADIDRNIRQIRTSIFQLHGAEVDASSFRRLVLDLSAELAPALSFAPRVAFAGAVDTMLTGDLADDVLACVREALSNVAKHAKASRVDVDINVQDDEVAIVITDDGVGIHEAGRTSGLANLRARAEDRGGSFTVSRAPGGGAQLAWKAPIR